MPERPFNESATEEQLKAIAAQFRKPEGEAGAEIAKYMNQGNHKINEYALEVLNLNHNDKILEIGMGNGFFVNQIVRSDNLVNYCGCDFSDLMVAHASENNRSLIDEGRVEFVTADAGNMPYGDNVFNCVLTVNTLYFWDPPEKVFAEIRRVLKPGGKLVLAIRPRAMMEEIPITRFGFKLFTLDDLSKLLSDNHFAVKSIEEKYEPDQLNNGEGERLATLLAVAIAE